MRRAARKHKKNVREIVTEHRQRSQLRRAELIEKQVDPVQLIRLQGLSCLVHYATPSEVESNMGTGSLVPWQNQLGLMIDRFDVRSSMDMIDLQQAVDENNRICKLDQGLVSIESGNIPLFEENERFERDSKYYERRFEAYRCLVFAEYKGMTEKEHLETVEFIDDMTNPFSPKIHKRLEGKDRASDVPMLSKHSAEIGFDYGSAKNSAVAAASSTPAVLEVFNGSEIEQKGSQDLHEPCDNVHNDPSVNDSIINQDLYEEIEPLDDISRQKLDLIAKSNYDISYFCTFLKRSRELIHHREQALVQQKVFTLGRLFDAKRDLTGISAVSIQQDSCIFLPSDQAKKDGTRSYRKGSDYYQTKSTITIGNGNMEMRCERLTSHQNKLPSFALPLSPKPQDSGDPNISPLNVNKDCKIRSSRSRSHHAHHHPSFDRHRDRISRTYRDGSCSRHKDRESCNSRYRHKYRRRHKHRCSRSNSSSPVHSKPVFITSFTAGSSDVSDNSNGVSSEHSEDDDYQYQRHYPSSAARHLRSSSSRYTLYASERNANLESGRRLPRASPDRTVATRSSDVLRSDASSRSDSLSRSPSLSPKMSRSHSSLDKYKTRITSKKERDDDNHDRNRSQSSQYDQQETKFYQDKRVNHRRSRLCASSKHSFTSHTNRDYSHGEKRDESVYSSLISSPSSPSIKQQASTNSQRSCLRSLTRTRSSRSRKQEIPPLSRSKTRIKERDKDEIINYKEHDPNKHQLKCVRNNQIQLSYGLKQITPMKQRQSPPQKSPSLFERLQRKMQMQLEQSLIEDKIKVKARKAEMMRLNIPFIK